MESPNYYDSLNFFVFNFISLNLPVSSLRFTFYVLRFTFYVSSPHLITNTTPPAIPPNQAPATISDK